MTSNTRDLTFPGVREKVSQMLGVLPSSAAAPSIWKAAVADPQTKPSGNLSRVLIL